MNPIDGGAPAANDLALSTQQPQANRLLWEQQWLQDNRDAFKAISEGPLSDFGAARTDINEMASVSAQASLQNVQNTGHAGAVWHEATATAVGSQVAQTQAPPLSGSAATPSQWLGENLRVQLETAANTASVAQRDAMSGSPRQAAKEFALWQGADGATAALRLRDKTRAPEAIATLREWLRAAGFTLRKVYVNGLIGYRRETPRSDGF